MKVLQGVLIEKVFLIITICCIIGIAYVGGHFSPQLYLVGILSWSNIAFSLFMMRSNKNGEFSFILSLILYFGGFLKFCLHQLMSYPWREPIGNFVESSQSFDSVLLVLGVGMAGVLLSQVFWFKVSSTRKEQLALIDNKSFKEIFKVGVVAVLISLALAVINFKCNILVFGLKPATNLPFKGNFLFFLTQTRFLIIFFLLLLGNRWNTFSLITFFLLASIGSISTLSRMIPVIGTFAIMIYVLKRFKDLKYSQVFLYLLVSFFFVGLTFISSTKLRKIVYSNVAKAERASKSRSIDSVEKKYVEDANKGAFVKSNEFKQVKSKTSEKKENLGSSKYDNLSVLFLQMVVDRWIALEGIMAVDSFESKGWDFFLKAIREPSYHGNSLYAYVSEGRKKVDLDKAKLIFTSVPGPIAFSYYSGSLIFVFIFMFASFTFVNVVLGALVSAGVRGMALSYITAFLAFDYFQFGISPFSFVKNWLFSIILIVIMVKLIKRFKIQKSSL